MHIQRRFRKWHCAMPPSPSGHGTKQKSARFTLKSLNQIIKSMHVEEAYTTWHFSIILISLRVEMAQISDFLVHDKILPLRKALFNLNLPDSTLGKKDITLIFLYLTSNGLFRSSISTNCWGTNIF